MEDFMNAVVKVITAIIVIFVVACISGFILWLIYPIVVNNVFPGLVENGTIANKISLWVAICTSWFFAILIKSSNTNKKD